MNWTRKNTPSYMFKGVKNKAGLRFAKRTLDAATEKVNLCDMCFEI